MLGAAAALCDRSVRCTCCHSQAERGADCWRADDAGQGAAHGQVALPSVRAEERVAAFILGSGALSAARGALCSRVCRQRLGLRAGFAACCTTLQQAGARHAMGARGVRCCRLGRRGAGARPAAAGLGSPL